MKEKLKKEVKVKVKKEITEDQLAVDILKLCIKINNNRKAKISEATFNFDISCYATYTKYSVSGDFKHIPNLGRYQIELSETQTIEGLKIIKENLTFVSKGYIPKDYEHIKADKFDRVYDYYKPKKDSSTK